MAFRKVELVGSNHALNQDIVEYPLVKNNQNINTHPLVKANQNLNENILKIIEDIVIKTLEKYGYKRLDNKISKTIKQKIISKEIVKHSKSKDMEVNKEKQNKKKSEVKQIGKGKQLNIIKPKWIFVTK